MGLQLDLILVSGLLALLYGRHITVALRACQRAPARPGCRKSRAAIQEGAAAYLNRQYTTIAIAGPW